MEAKIDDVKRKTDELKASGYLTDTGVLSPVSILYINIKYTVHPVTDSSVLLPVSVIYTYQSNVLNLKINQFLPIFSPLKDSCTCIKNCKERTDFLAVLRATGKINLLLLTALPSLNKVITYLLIYYMFIT